MCDTTGTSAIPTVFRRPIVWVNYLDFAKMPTGGVQDLLIPKKFWLRKEHRFLTLREILDLGIDGFSRTEQHEQLGIECVENTPEEITALAVEMDERLKGKWQTSPEDEGLQQRFRSFFRPSDLPQIAVLRIGAEFLRQNRALLK